MSIQNLVVFWPLILFLALAGTVALVIVVNLRAGRPWHAMPRRRTR